MRPDDSLLDSQQLTTVQRHADRLLREAGAIGRYPTPIDDLLAAAKLILVDDELLDEGVLRQFMSRAAASIATIKSALSKVLGLFDANDRLVVIDACAPKPRIPFIKLHEAAHGTLPHQSKVYRLMHDCEKTLDPEIADLFEREANVFASEVLFQGEEFSQEARSHDFGIKVPMKLARKYGASNYATFRRYVITSPHVCCVVILEPPIYMPDRGVSAEVRRVVMSKSFAAIYDGKTLGSRVVPGHPLQPTVPACGKRLNFEREIVLIDRNCEERICHAEAFDTKHQVLVLIRDIGLRRRSGIILPRKISRSA